MTAPEPALSRARQWATEVVAALDEITGDVTAAARRLADGWPDAQGRDWVERLHQLRHALDRDADAATDFGRTVDRVAHDTGASPAFDTGTDPDPLSGPQLGGLGGRRADDRRGVTIPQLDEPADLSG